jgi:hypothetical protein
MFLCICICLFACACSSSRHVAIRSRIVSELRGIDSQASATKWPSSSSSTRLKILSICLVKASVLWPIMSHLLYNSLSRILWTTYGFTSFLFTWFLITFWATMVRFMLSLYFNQWTWCEHLWYDVVTMVMMLYLRHSRGLERFLECLSERTCSLDDRPGKQCNHEGGMGCP